MIYSQLKRRFTIFTSATISDRRYFLKDVVKRGWVGSAQSCSYVSGGTTGEIPGVEEVLDFGGSVMPTGLKHKYAVVNEQGKKLGLLRQWLKKTTAKKIAIRHDSVSSILRPAAPSTSTGLAISKKITCKNLVCADNVDL